MRARRARPRSRADGDGAARSAPASTLATLARLGAARALRRGRRRRPSLAASPLLRNVGTVGGNLCQGTRCWYYRGEEWHCWLGGGDTCYAQIGDHRKHNLAARRLHLRASLRPRAGARRAAARASSCARAAGERELALLDLYRIPTEENRSLLTLEHGEIVSEVRLPAPPRGLGVPAPRRAPGVLVPARRVAAARRGGARRARSPAASRTSPSRIDPADPLAAAAGQPADDVEADRARDADRAGRRGARRG